MKQSLPPLLALRAFDAAARHLSFKAAANELFVTPSSVSHQIKKLEDWLGVALFVRFNREVALTRSGRDYAVVVSRAFTDIADATSAIERRSNTKDGRQRLVISANSGFVDCWLNARMREFCALVPEIDVEITYGEDLNDYRHRDADIAIHFGSTAPPTPNAVFLRKCMEFVVCSPSLSIAGAPLETLADLGNVTLLHERDRLTWRAWLNDAGAPTLRINGGPVFQNTSTIFARVEAGEGVAIGDDIVAADYLFAKRLVKPLPIVRESVSTIYLIPLQPDRSPQAVDAFCAWLIETLKAHERETEEIRRPATYPLDIAEMTNHTNVEKIG
jgi:LysR family glycine cleavage system transcriptional activator